ncbi:MAG: GNAT family N-acetyltransferase, partial [Bacteroidetes bacterium]|nr:GNAT family N-acetyltransferase [Bacteroidota bacterium]
MKANMEVFEEGKDDYLINTDQNKLDLVITHQFLRDAYWCKNIPYDIFKKSAQNSLCFGLYYQGRQIGFARIVSDYATIAYIGDVFILPEYRGKGLSKWLMEVVMKHPELQGLRRWSLVTADAHGLYLPFGFRNLSRP